MCICPVCIGERVFTYYENEILQNCSKIEKMVKLAIFVAMVTREKTNRFSFT